TKIFSGLKMAGSARPSASEMTVWIASATTGVLRTGSTVPTAFGSAPALPIPNHIHVATFVHARLAAITDVNIANRANGHAPPQTRWAITSAGSSSEVGSLVRLLVPHPITCPQITKISRRPTIAIDAIVAAGEPATRSRDVVALVLAGNPLAVR